MNLKHEKFAGTDQTDGVCADRASVSSRLTCCFHDFLFRSWSLSGGGNTATGRDGTSCRRPLELLSESLASSGSVDHSALPASSPANTGGLYRSSRGGAVPTIQSPVQLLAQMPAQQDLPPQTELKVIATSYVQTERGVCS